MELVPVDIIKSHLVRQLEKNSIYNFRMVCKSFRGASLEEFAMIKHGCIVNHLTERGSEAPCEPPEIRTERDWKKYMGFRKLCELTDEWDRLYPEIERLGEYPLYINTINSALYVEDSTGKIDLPNPFDLWAWIIGKDCTNTYRRRIFDARSCPRTNFSWGWWRNIDRLRFPIDGSLNDETMSISPEEMLAYLEGHWQSVYEAYVTEINKFRKGSLGLEEIKPLL